MVSSNHQQALTHPLLGPDHNRSRIRRSDFERADLAEGFEYELIDGVLHVSPAPGPDSAFIEGILLELLVAYKARVGAAASFSRITTRGRILVRDSEESTTNPEPDIAAYRRAVRGEGDSWEGINPALVIEIVSRGYAEKDYVRNVRLYESVPEILEYWVVDPRRHPVVTMSVFRRGAGDASFERIDVPRSGTYESRLWPGLVIDVSVLLFA